MKYKYMLIIRLQTRKVENIRKNKTEYDLILRQ